MANINVNTGFFISELNELCAKHGVRIVARIPVRQQQTILEAVCSLPASLDVPITFVPIEEVPSGNS